MNTATQALDFLTKYEEIRQQGIQELEAAKADIESKLARLRGELKAPAKESKTGKPRTCKVCGSIEHKSRFHKSVRTEETPERGVVQAA